MGQTISVRHSSKAIVELFHGIKTSIYICCTCGRHRTIMIAQDSQISKNPFWGQRGSKRIIILTVCYSGLDFVHFEWIFRGVVQFRTLRSDREHTLTVTNVCIYTLYNSTRYRLRLERTNSTGSTITLWILLVMSIVNCLWKVSKDYWKAHQRYMFI